MLTEYIDLVGSSDVKAGLLGGGPKSKPRTYAAAMVELSAAITKEKKQKRESEAPDSPQSSAAHTVDSVPNDDPEKEYMEMASNNYELKFVNNGNQCSLTTMLHLMLSQPEIKEAILGTRIK